MRQLAISTFGLALMISGFLVIASLSSSLSPQALSQEAPPPENFDPSQMNIPDATSLPPEGAAPVEGAAENPSSEPMPEPVPAMESVETSAVTGEVVPVRQDPFIPVVPPSRPQSNVLIPSEVDPTQQGPVSDEFYDPNDPWRAFYLREYKLTGVLWSTTSPKAMFITPEGRTLTVKRKTFLGREGAVVLTVRESEVIFLLPGPGRNYENGTVKIVSMRK